MASRARYRRRWWFALAALACLALAGAEARAGAPVVLTVGPNKLYLTVPAWTGLKRDGRLDDQLRAWWHGTLGRSQVDLEVRIFPRRSYFLDEPEDVTAFAIDVYRLPERDGDPRFAFQTQEAIPGPYGWIPRAALCRGALPSAATPLGEVWMLAGILETYGYEVTLKAHPPLSETHRSELLTFFRTGVRAECPVQDPLWTDAELEKRWNESVADPAVRAERRPILRTKHFIILTNSSAGRSFATKMEGFYKRIQKTFSFPEVANWRLMPVFLFRTEEQYHGFYAHVATASMDEAQATNGYAWKDFYATSCASPSDPVHIHQATHQVLMNRARLRGGGSFFQEGAAEYMATKASQRKAWARPAARSGEFVPLRDLVQVEDLTKARNSKAAVLQAASWIAFLSEEKQCKGRFPEFVQRVGLAPAGNVQILEQIVKELYGVTLEELEARWVAWWSKR